MRTLLRQHKDGVRGSIHQEPYKGDFFELFAIAFNGGLITSGGQPGYLSADALADIINERAPDVTDSHAFGHLHTFWREWAYAWRRCDESMSPMLEGRARRAIG